MEIVFESQSVAAVDGVELFEGLRATDDGTRNAQFGGDAAVGRKDGQFPRKVAGAVGRIVSYRDFSLLARENRFTRISGCGATAGRSDLEDHFGVFPFVAADETMRNRAVGFADGAEIPRGPVEYQPGLGQARQSVQNQHKSQLVGFSKHLVIRLILRKDTRFLQKKRDKFCRNKKMLYICTPKTGVNPGFRKSLNSSVG